MPRIQGFEGITEVMKDLSGIRKDEFDRKKITVKDGKIQSVMKETLAEDKTLVADNLKTAETLKNAAKILSKKKPDKAHEKEAKSVAKYYSSRMGKKSSENVNALIGRFNLLSEELWNQTIRVWGKGRELPSKEVMQSRFKNITDDKGHGSDGADIFRHLTAGIVSLEDAKGDLFEKSGIARDDLALEEGVVA